MNTIHTFRFHFSGHAAMVSGSMRMFTFSHYILIALYFSAWFQKKIHTRTLFIRSFVHSIVIYFFFCTPDCHKRRKKRIQRENLIFINKQYNTAFINSRFFERHTDKKEEMKWNEMQRKKKRKNSRAAAAAAAAVSYVKESVNHDYSITERTRCALNVFSLGFFFGNGIIIICNRFQCTDNTIIITKLTDFPLFFAMLVCIYRNKKPAHF